MNLRLLVSKQFGPRSITNFQRRTFTKMAPTTRNHANSDKEKLEGEENQWKFRAPYKIHNEDTFKSRYEGGCHCGKVQFHVNQTKPLEAKYCHCTTCQALHGEYKSRKA